MPARPLSEIPFQETIWRHFRVGLPANWEMLQFSRNPEKGRCSFFDRYRVRCEINWQAVPGAPDTRRMLSDYTARLQDEGVEAIEPVHYGPWAGLIGQQDGHPVSRFGRYLEEEKCLFELVLPWPHERDLDLEKQILEGHSVEALHEGHRRWRAFGIEAIVPDGYLLDECSQHPGRSEFVFRPEKGCGELVYQRLGFVSEWLCGPLESWLREQASNRIEISLKQRTSGGGHETYRLHGYGKLWNRGLQLRRPLYESCVARSPHDGRLHFAAHTFPKRSVQKPLNCGIPCPSMRPPDADAQSPTVQNPGNEEWAGMLQSKPLRNRAAHTEFRGSNLVVSVPRDPGKSLKAPLSWIVPVSKVRSAMLDDLGREVWEQCNGGSSVEQIIERFARRHTLTFHEARVSVTGYLKGLVQRGILALEMGAKQ
jgi:hypothetical protein